jgi:hypothetical protein
MLDPEKLGNALSDLASAASVLTGNGDSNRLRHGFEILSLGWSVVYYSIKPRICKEVFVIFCKTRLPEIKKRCPQRDAPLFLASCPTMWYNRSRIGREIRVCI